MKKPCFALVPSILGGKMSLSYRIFIMTMVVIGITGCAMTIPTIIFTDISGDNRGLQNLLRDRYECLEEASSEGSRISGSSSDSRNAARAAINGESGRRSSRSAFSACLAARAWLRDDTAIGSPSSITLPQGAVIQFTDN